MEPLQVDLLGGIAVKHRGEVLSKFHSSKSRLLIAYLADHADQIHSRAKIANLLWPELPDKTARANLRNEVSKLARLLEGHLAFDRSQSGVLSIQSAFCQVDTRAFCQHLQAAGLKEGQSLLLDPSRLVKAVSLYRGLFLQGIKLSDDVPEMQSWRMVRQRELHDAVLRALRALQLHSLETGNWDELAKYAQQALDHSPKNTAAHAYFIQALVALSRTDQALQHHQQLLDNPDTQTIAQSPEVLALIERLRLKPKAGNPTTRRQTGLPPGTAVLGRDTTLNALVSRVTTEPYVALVGALGSGKSTLLNVLAERLNNHFSKGIYCVSCFGAIPMDDDREAAAHAIVLAARQPCTSKREALPLLKKWLSHPHSLLILDDVDQLGSAGAALIKHLKSTCQGHVLCTYTSAPPAFLEGKAFRLNAVEHKEATRLFEKKAQAWISHASDLFRAEAETVKQLMALLEDNPQALHWCASWLEHFSLAEITQSLMDMPVTNDKPSTFSDGLWRAFLLSWGHLDSEERAYLCTLSAFSGSFDKTAARALAGCESEDLTRFVDSGFLKRAAQGRLVMRPAFHIAVSHQMSTAQFNQAIEQLGKYYLDLFSALDRGRKTAYLSIECLNLLHLRQRLYDAGHFSYHQQLGEQFSDCL